MLPPERRSTVDSIVEQVRKLTAEERADLLDRLIVESAEGTFDRSVADEWTAEIRRRVEESRSGRLTCQPWEEVHAEISERLRQHRERREKQE